jgi:predicted phage gp36 major capsid-like protein
MENLVTEPETKAIDVASAFDEFRRSFEIYKEQNDSRIDELKSRSPDPITEEKVAKLGAVVDANKRLLDELVLKNSRPALAHEEKTLSVVEIEHKKAFDAYVRHGEVAPPDDHVDQGAMTLRSERLVQSESRKLPGTFGNLIFGLS